MLKYLKEQDSLSVLDIGPTSPTNINFLTSLGHSCFMSDAVHEALIGNWELPSTDEGGEPVFDLDGYFEQNLNFGGRQFDVVLLWSSLDYLPSTLIAPFVQRLHEAVKPDGRILAIFHSKMTGQDTAFCRYHLTDGENIEMQETAPHSIQRVYTNRSIEKLFSKFSNYKFFLAKDNLYEVIITR